MCGHQTGERPWGVIAGSGLSSGGGGRWSSVPHFTLQGTSCQRGSAHSSISRPQVAKMDISEFISFSIGESRISNQEGGEGGIRTRGVTFGRKSLSGGRQILSRGHRYSHPGRVVGNGISESAKGTPGDESSLPCPPPGSAYGLQIHKIETKLN